MGIGEDRQPFVALDLADLGRLCRVVLMREWDSWTVDGWRAPASPVRAMRAHMPRRRRPSDEPVVGRNKRSALRHRVCASLLRTCPLSAGRRETSGLQPRYSPDTQVRSCPSSHWSAAAKSSPRAQKRSKRSTYGVEDSAERTTQLAADRTVFAAERTYAAWVRTGLLALASGIGAKALLSEVVSQ